MSDTANDFSILDDAGLNLHAVFNLNDLPVALTVQGERGSLGEPGNSSGQLILIGHAGRRLWEQLGARATQGEHPIDDYTIETVRGWLASVRPGVHFRILYPGDGPIGLQALGQLAGWHHRSPFMIGVNTRFGSWFAYRAVVVGDFGLPVTPPSGDVSPCPACAARVCIAACPAGALEGGSFNLDACSAYRLSDESRCAYGCLARGACPVGSDHRYDDAQVRHSYSRSLEAIRHYGGKRPVEKSLVVAPAKAG